MHCKTFSKAICLMRMREKYGIRILKEDEETAWAALRPGVEFIGLDIAKIFDLCPLPHGTQRNDVVKLLKEWGWSARPLQPGKGSYSHMTWRVGAAEDPPQMVMPGFNLEVVISQVKELKQKKFEPKLIASNKTQRHLTSAASSSSSSTSDPWLSAKEDPWAGWNKKTTPAATQGKSRLDSIREELCADVKQSIRKELETHMETDTASSSTMNEATEARFQALEVGVQELTKQNGQFLQWFHEAGDRTKATEQSVQEVQNTLGAHQQRAAQPGQHLSDHGEQHEGRSFTRDVSILQSTDAEDGGASQEASFGQLTRAHWVQAWAFLDATEHYAL